MFPVFQQKDEIIQVADPNHKPPPRREAKKLERKPAAKYLGFTEEDFDRESVEPDFPAARKIAKPGAFGLTLKWLDTDLDRYRERKIEERDRLIRLFPIKK